MTTPDSPTRCTGCHRLVVVGPVLHDGDGAPYGPKCGTRRGLAERRVRVRAPARTGEAEPVLDGWDELTEINEESEGTWASCTTPTT